jgi:hypothetical protein
MQGVEAAVVGVHDVPVSGRHLGRQAGPLTEDGSPTIHCRHGHHRGVWGGAISTGRVAPVDPDEAVPG